MIKALYCNSTNRNFGNWWDIDSISDLIQDRNNLFWLDLLDPIDQELEKMAEEFNFHPLAVEDAGHSHQRPKVDDYCNYFFVVFYSLDFQNSAKSDLQFRELKMFVGPNYLVTVHFSAVPELEEAEKRWKRQTDQFDHGIGILLYSILDTIVDNYFPAVDRLVEQVEELEDQIFKGNAGQRALTEKLLDLKNLFLQLRRIAAPQRDVLNVLTNRDSPLFDERTLIYFRDVYDHIIRVTDTLDIYRDQLNSVMDANLAVVSNDLNKVMRTLTAASIILMANSLISGIYGMNFENMPELKTEYGYFVVLAFMFTITIALFFFFKRLKWF